jgi:O-acetylserine/cysteine efflux transporter
LALAAGVAAATYGSRADEAPPPGVETRMTATRLTWRHALLALAIVAVWGTNFAFIRIGLDRLPPLLFAALRFAFAVVPAVFLLRRPRGVAWKNLALYGLFSGPGQFGVLYLAMKGLISPGLASLVIQTQVFFTIGLALLIDREKVKGPQLAAIALASAGILLIVLHADAATTPLGLAMTLFSALCWAGGNMTIKAAKPDNAAAYVAWASLFSAPPLFVLSFLFEGWPAMRAGLVHADAVTWAVVLWQAFGNVLFGFAAWGWLLKRYSAATIAPTALLVPVFGMGASAVLLGEPPPLWKLLAAGLVIGGLALGMLWPHRPTAAGGPPRPA